jgi:regulator of protease activity HflC (stomatin/prohibitin superfamily)
MVMNNTNAVDVSIQAVSAPESVSAIAGVLITAEKMRAHRDRLANPDMSLRPWELF